MKAKRKAKATPVAPVEVAHEAVLVERPKKTAELRRREQEEALGGIKNAIFLDSMQVIGDTLKFRDLDITLQRDLDPAYEKMVAELGEEEAQKTYRVALAGWGKAADAPVAVKVAANMAVGIMKANAAEKGGPKILNVQRIMIGAEALPTFEEREVTGE